MFAGTGAAASLLAERDLAVVVPPGDAEAIAAAVDRILAAPDSALALAERARRDVESSPSREEAMAQAAALVVAGVAR